MPEDDDLVSKLSEMSAAELLEAVGAAASQRIAHEKKEVAAQAVRDYIAKRNSILDHLGTEHALNQAALELDRRLQNEENES